MNKEQTEAYEKLTGFVNCLDTLEQKFFLLNGPGGSGKTFLVRHILHEIKEKEIKYNVCAPTHKAAGVLKKSLDGFPVLTVDKLLGYEQVIDDTGSKNAVYTLPKIRAKLLIIDECSMISKKQLEALIKYGASVIFIGDKCQINPVSEPEGSQIFDLEFSGIATLVENERLKTNKPLLDIINLFRKSVIAKCLKNECVSNAFCINKHDREKFNDLLFKSFESKEETVYISWTNKSVIEYNDKIRKHLFGPKYQDTEIPRFCVSEKLVATEFIKGPKIYTSQVFTVRSSEIVEMNLYGPQCTCGSGIEYKFVNTSEDTLSTEKTQKCDACKTPTSEAAYVTGLFLALTFKETPGTYYKPYEKNLKNYACILDKYRTKIKENIKKGSNSTKLWNPYYDLRQTLDAPFDYVYAITAHKSQGSGYRNVFVDIENMSFNKEHLEKLRLYYTAASRSTHSLIMIRP